MTLQHSDPLLHWAAQCVSIALTVVAQLLLRVGVRSHQTYVAGLVNPRSLASYALFVVVVFLMVFALQVIPLRSAMALNASTYVLVPLTTRLFLAERLPWRTMVGGLLVALGILVFFL